MATVTQLALLGDSAQSTVSLSEGLLPNKRLSGFADGFALQFLAVIAIARDGNWAPSNGTIYGTFLACVLSHGVIASVAQKIMGKLQTTFVAMNFILIVATIIALPIGRANNRNDGAYIFGDIENLTTWPTGWAFMLAWLSPLWTVGGFDSCVHISEEAANAPIAVPHGILMAVGLAWFFGFILVVVIAACMKQDLSAILSTPFGQPMAQVRGSVRSAHELV